MMRVWLLFALMGSSCAPDTGDGPSHVASNPPRVAKPTKPDNPRSSPQDLKAEADTGPLGWWRSDSVCLELFENGDFELSSRGQGPKVLVMGRVEVVESAGNEQTLRLAVKRIWQTRWSTPCRRRHEFGKWANEENILGHRFSPDEVVSITVERLGDDVLRLCVESCVELERDTPLLGGRWSRPKSSNAELVELALYETGQRLVLENGSKVHKLRVQGEAKFVGLDVFEITLIPMRSDLDIRLFDTPVPDGQPRRLGARRLAGQRLEVCDEAGQCGILERQFDSDRTTFR